MQYSVIGSDGNQYGPVDLITLKQWVADGRVMPHTQVIDNLASTTLMANQMPELGMTSVTGHYANTTAPPQNYNNYPRPGEMQVPKVKRRTRLWGILFWFALGTVLSPFLLTGGLLTNGLNILEAFRAKSEGDPNAGWCMVIALTGFTISILVMVSRHN